VTLLSLVRAVGVAIVGYAGLVAITHIADAIVQRRGVAASGLPLR